MAHAELFALETFYLHKKHITFYYEIYYVFLNLKSTFKIDLLGKGSFFLSATVNTYVSDPALKAFK